jgi:hypothetical protein
VLGCYLGDGHVTHTPPNGWELRLACDQRYAGIIAEIRLVLRCTFPGSRPPRFAASTGASDVLRISHPAIGVAFPQHGLGRNHRNLSISHRHSVAILEQIVGPKA